MENKIQRRADCRKAAAMMFEYADKTLNAADSAWLEQHVEGCPDCAAELEKCRRTLELIHYSKFESRYNIKDAVMNRIVSGENDTSEKEKTHNPLISAFTGFIKGRRYFPVGTVAAAAIILTVVIFNYDALFNTQKNMSRSFAADSNESDIYDTTADEALKSAATFYTSPASGNEESAADNGAEEYSLDMAEMPANSLVPSLANGLADSSTTEAETQDVSERKTAATGNDTEESASIMFGIQGLESDEYLVNTVAYISSSDVLRTVEALGLDPIDTIEYEDSSIGYVCVYSMSTQTELVDYLMLHGIDFEVTFTNIDIPTEQTMYIVIQSMQKIN